jgi:hypothetical protein
MLWSLFWAMLKTNQGADVMVAILGNVENKSGVQCYVPYFGQCWKQIRGPMLWSVLWAIFNT